jgi:hypothetical protein
VAGIKRRRPDFRSIFAHAVLAPLTVPVLGQLVTGLTLIPLLPLAGIIAVLSQRNLLPILSAYIAFGTFGYGLAIQVRWFFDETGTP